MKLLYVRSSLWHPEHERPGPEHCSRTQKCFPVWDVVGGRAVGFLIVFLLTKEVLVSDFFHE